MSKWTTHHILRHAESEAVHAKAAGQSYSAGQVAKLYGWSSIAVAGSPQKTIYLLELGGGYNVAKINAQFADDGYPAPQLSFVGLLGATNAYTGDGNGPDGEVELDIVCAGEAYSESTGRAAKIVCVFCPNSDAGFVGGVQWIATNSDGGPGSISWGGPESDFDNITAMDQAFQTGLARGIQFTVASGDNLSDDGTGTNTLDYPGSSSYVICCGGTSIVTSGNAITNESVWNSGGGEGTGGGFSKIELQPTWQAGFTPVGSLRAAPDVSLNADPASGYRTPFGVIGGTSAAAPMMAALLCVLAETRAFNGTANTFLYANEPLFFDVTAGNNSGFSASKGYDEASGLGVPRPGKPFVTAWLSGVTVPPPPISPPPPVVFPPPPPVNPQPPATLLPQVLGIVNQGFAQLEAVTRQIPWFGATLTRDLQIENQNIDAAITRLFAVNGQFVSRATPKVTVTQVLSIVEMLVKLLGPAALPIIDKLIESSNLTAGEKQFIESTLSKLLS